MAGETEIERMVVRLVGDSATFRSMMREASGLTRKLGQDMTRLGRTMTTRVTLPLAVLGGAAVKAFSDFDQAMTESTSIMSVTGDQVERMRDLSLSLAGESTKGPEELARSYFFLASAGKDAEQSMALLPQVTKFATAGAFDMALATDLLTDAQSALGLSVKDASKDLENMTRLSDVLVKANTLANASVQQFSEAVMTDAGATMKNFNIDLEEGVAVLAAYADQSIKGAHAGNMFGRMTRLLTSAARTNAEAYEEMNIAVFDADGNMRNFADILGDMERELGGLSTEAKGAALELLGFETLAQKAILPLIGTSDAIRGYQEGLEGAKGITEEVSEKQLKSFSNQMKILKNQITTVAIDIGETLAPTVQRLGEFVKDLVGRWQGLSEEQKLTVIRFAAIVAAAGPVMIVLGNMIKLLGLLKIALIKTGFGAIAVALGVLAAQFLGTKEGVAELNKILEPFRGLWEQLKNLWKELEPIVVSLAKALGTTLLAALKLLAPIIAKTLETLVGIGSAIANAINKALEAGDKTENKEVTNLKDRLANSRQGADELQDLINQMPDDSGLPKGIGSRGQLQARNDFFDALKQSQFDPNIGAKSFIDEMGEITEKAKELAKERAKVEKEQLERIQEDRKMVDDTLIASLEKQTATYGKTRREIALYDAAQLNATKTQRDAINTLFDQIEGLEAQEKAKEDTRRATEEAREAEERFQNSIKGFGIEGVGRGIEAMARIEESRRLRAAGSDDQSGMIAKTSPKLKTNQPPPDLAARLEKSQEKMLAIQMRIEEHTRRTAEKDPIEVTPADIGG